MQVTCLVVHAICQCCGFVNLFLETDGVIKRVSVYISLLCPYM